MKTLFSEFKFTPAVLVLIAMNLIPLVGVFWFDWDAGTIVFLYWIENVVIGILNIPKILLAQKSPARQGKAKSDIFLSVFFAFHYGLFCFGHYLVLQATYETIPEFGNMFTALLGPVLFWSVLGLTLSHFISMALNFLGRKEYRTQSARDQMFAPYKRIILLHVVIIFSGLIAVTMGEGLAMLVMLVGLKISVDLAAHLREHAKIRQKAAEAS